jgi:hypothetical protein
MSETPGVNATYWWVGQIVDEKNWQKSQTGLLHRPTDTKGETFSYKVRIVGRHTPETPSIDLPTASVALPVTAGGGLAGSVQTPNIRQGSYVVGFYRDGKEGNEPFIAFVLPVNPKTSLFPEEPEKGFTARSAFTDKPIPTGNIGAENNPTESIDPNLYTTADRDRYVDGRRFFYLPKTKACEGPSGPLKGIQKSIGDAITITNLIKSGVLGSASDLSGLLNNELTSIQNRITGLTKTLIDSMRTSVMNKINKEFSEKLDQFNPQERIKYSKAFESANDIIFCLFQKILNRLPNIIRDLFDSVIDKYVNAPLCAAENFLAEILSNVFGELSDGISGVLAFSGIGDVTNQIYSGLSIFVGVLEFLTCEDDINCEMNEQWSIFSGPKKALENIGSDIDKRIAGITSSIINDENNLSCSTSQVPCGPPTVRFLSNSGSGASANPIVSFTGSIIGFDIISGGSDYTSSPTVEIVDKCGNGSGAIGIAIMRKDDSSVVDNVVMVDSGAGYLQYPDGSTGGDGFVFSNPNDTIIFNETSGYSVYGPGTVVDVLENDLIYFKTFANAEVYDPSGNVLQDIIGRGQTVPVTIGHNGTLTTPVPNDITLDRGNFPSSDNSYPVVLTIDDIAITNSGSNYKNGDEVVLTPSNGAEISISFDVNGSIKNVIVNNGGIGFTEIPKITIKTKTGFNANLIPVFKVLRVGDVKENQDVIPPNTPIMNVIDCVGVVEK